MGMNQVTKCAAGAMLFGGTLGLATSADAGLIATSAQFALDAGGVYAFNYAVSALGSPLSAVGANSSVTFTGLNSLGFGLSAASDGIEVWNVWRATIGFTVDSNTTVRLTGNIDTSAAVVYLINTDDSTPLFIRGDGTGAWDSGEIQLVAGVNYMVGVNGPIVYPNGGTETGTVLSFAVVPAPGAAALVGLAGLVARRRRA